MSLFALSALSELCVKIYLTQSPQRAQSFFQNFF
jgi:hypothetical protein